MAFEYFCTKCHEDFLPGRFIEGTLHCPFCGTHYDITVLKHNNIEKHNQEQLTKRQNYTTNHISAILVITLVTISLYPLLVILGWTEPPEIRPEFVLLSPLFLLILEIFVVGLIYKHKAKKLFPPMEED